MMAGAPGRPSTTPLHRAGAKPCWRSLVVGLERKSAKASQPWELPRCLGVDAHEVGVFPQAYTLSGHLATVGVTSLCSARSRASPLDPHVYRLAS